MALIGTDLKVATVCVRCISCSHMRLNGACVPADRTHKHQSVQHANGLIYRRIVRSAQPDRDQ